MDGCSLWTLFLDAFDSLWLCGSGYCSVAWYLVSFGLLPQMFEAGLILYAGSCCPLWLSSLEFGLNVWCQDAIANSVDQLWTSSPCWFLSLDLLSNYCCCSLESSNWFGYRLSCQPSKDCWDRYDSDLVRGKMSTGLSSAQFCKVGLVRQACFLLCPTYWADSGPQSSQSPLEF